MTSLLLGLYAIGGGGRGYEFLGFEFARPMGRYVAGILPITLVLGYAGFLQKEKLSKKTRGILTIILGCTTALTITALFPFNNQDLAYIGALRFGLEQFTSTGVATAIFFIGLVIAPWILYKLCNKKRIVAILFIFLLLSSMTAFAMTSWNSKTQWYEGDQMQAGLWLNEYDPGYSVILIDQDDQAKVEKTKQAGLYEQFGYGSASIMGVWLNDNIRIGDITNPGEADFIITTKQLEQEPVHEQGHIFIYETKVAHKSSTYL